MCFRGRHHQPRRKAQICFCLYFRSHSRFYFVFLLCFRELCFGLFIANQSNQLTTRAVRITRLWWWWYSTRIPATRLRRASAGVCQLTACFDSFSMESFDLIAQSLVYTSNATVAPVPVSFHGGVALDDSCFIRCAIIGCCLFEEEKGCRNPMGLFVERRHSAIVLREYSGQLNLLSFVFVVD